MIRDGGQFGSFDGLDNRREIMRLFARLGEHLTEQQAGKRRALFLKSLIKTSSSGFARSLPKIKACSTVEAYTLFFAIIGCLGVDVNDAAGRLQRLVRAQ